MSDTKNAIGNLIKHLRMIQWQTINIEDISAQLSVLNLHLSYPFFFHLHSSSVPPVDIFIFCSLLNFQFYFYFFDGSGSYTHIIHIRIYVKMSLILFVNNSMPMNLIPFLLRLLYCIINFYVHFSHICLFNINSNFYN